MEVHWWKHAWLQSFKVRVCWLFFRHNQDKPLLVPLISCWSSSGVSPRAVCVVKSTVSSPEITEGSVTAANSWPQMDHVSILVMQIWGLSCFTGWKWEHPHLLHQLCLAYLISGLGWCDLFVKLDAFRKSNPSGPRSERRYRVHRIYSSLIDIQLWFSSVIAGLDAINKQRLLAHSRQCGVKSTFVFVKCICQILAAGQKTGCVPTCFRSALPLSLKEDVKTRTGSLSFFCCVFLMDFLFFLTLSWALC